MTANPTSIPIQAVMPAATARGLRREWIAAAGAAVLAVAVTLLPYILGYLLARPGFEFTGVLMNPEDSNSYLAKMQQGYEGRWLYEIPFTSEPQTPAFLGGFYLLLGQLARLMSLSVIQMWHLARVGCALALFLATFAFIRSFLPETRARWFAYSLALAGSGLGWILFLFGQTDWLGSFPVDFKMPEAHLFFSALAFPHFAAGALLILSSLWLCRRALETGQWRFSLAAGLANLALAIIYPFLIYLIAAVLAVYWVGLCLETRRFQFREALAAGAALAVPAPLLLYYFAVLQTDPVFRAWDAQAATPSPNPLHYLVAYGVMLLLAAPTWRRREFRWLWAWLLAVALLLYAPLNPQRRFVEGVQIPLAILSAAGLAGYYLPRLRATTFFRRLGSRPRYSAAGLERLVLILLLLFLALSNVYVLASMSLTAALQQPDPLFRSLAEVNAVDWAGVNLPRGAVILAAYETGSFIPTRTGLRAVIGHWAETMDFQSKYDAVGRFYNPSTDEAWRTAFLAAQRVDYIFYGPRERALGGDAPQAFGDFTCVYDSAGVEIFRVDR